MGEKAGRLLASILKALRLYDLGTPFKPSIKFDEVALDDLLETASLHPYARTAASCMHSVEKRAFTPSVYGCVITLVTEADQDKAGQFRAEISNGEGLTEGDPALLLRRRFLEQYGKRAMSPMHQAALLIKAWNAFVDERKPAFLRWQEDEPFPLIYGAVTPGSARKYSHE